MSSIRHPLSRLLCCLLLLVLLCPSASATTKPTKFVNALTFSERYALFYSGYADIIDDTLTNSVTDALPYSSTPNSYICSAGLLTLDSDTLDVDSLYGILLSIDDDSNVGVDSDEGHLSLLASISALEYDSILASVSELSELVSVPIYENGIALISAQSILSSITDELFDDSNSVSDALFDGEKVLVYSGNYDYYLEIFIGDSVSPVASGWNIYLCAEARY